MRNTKKVSSFLKIIATYPPERRRNMARSHLSLTKALRDYWQKKRAYEQAQKSRYFIASCTEMLNQAVAAICSFSEQEAESFSFRYWYLIHLVFPEDIGTYRKMLSRAEKPHEKLYVLVVGVVYVDQHYGRPGWTRKDLNEFQGATLFPWIDSFRKTTEPMMNAKEYDRVSRLVRNSPLNRGIEHCAFAWILGSTEGMELHRYPVR